MAEEALAPPPSSQKISMIKVIEYLGNKLPHPFMMFFYLSLFVMAASYLGSQSGIQVTHPSTGETVAIQNLLSQAGLTWILTNLLTNFTSFKPLGLVLGMLLGIGLAERVGLIQVALKTILMRVPARSLTFMVFITGIIGNLASDAALVIIPPLAAMMFHSVGRHPIAGLAAGFAGVSSGFTANIFITGTDALLSGITSEVLIGSAQSLEVTPLSNWFFMSFSVLFLGGIGVFVTEKIIIPRLGQYKGTVPFEKISISRDEKRGLVAAAVASLVYGALILSMVYPEQGILRHPETGSITGSPFLKGIVPILIGYFIVVATIYGKITGKIKRAADIPNMMGEAIATLAPFIVMVFACAQFIAFFKWSNLGIFVAVSGAEFLNNANLSGLPLIIGFILIAALLNIVITSGSAQWALMAPIFVPMLMLLDYHPAFIQLCFRIADSSTNTISPLNAYVPMILVFMQKYDKSLGLGNLLSLMMPFAAIFLTTWILLMLFWLSMGWPVGVDAPIYLP